MIEEIERLIEAAARIAENSTSLLVKADVDMGLMYLRHALKQQREVESK